MNQENMNQILELLEKEFHVYEEILKLSKQKTNIIVEGKVSELDNVVKLEQSLVLQISKIDKEREGLFNSLSGDVKVNNKNWNVTELKKYADSEQTKRLEAYKSNMTKLLEELNHANQLNSKLIKNSLEFIEFSLNIISTPDVASNNYGNRGISANKEKKNLFDIRL